MKPEIHVDVALRDESTAAVDEVRDAVVAYLHSSAHHQLYGDWECSLSFGVGEEFLREHVATVRVSDTSRLFANMGVSDSIDLRNATLKVHVYHLYDSLGEGETGGGSGSWTAASDTIATDGGDDAAPQLENGALLCCHLPARELERQWESLFFDDETLKGSLLRYVRTALLFSERQVDGTLVSWNRVVLLHGPPGTGKTSLCKALAHKMAIQLGDVYGEGHILEINAHSLFSKWFSESGKLVMELFKRIQSLAENPKILVCVLIDEVESLSASRKAAAAGAEPSDAVRVVNALLTQLDQLKRFANVLVLATSNVTEALDVAFLDRADIKQYVGPPSQAGIYEILRHSTAELMRTGIVQPHIELYDLKLFAQLSFHAMEVVPSQRLYEIAGSAKGLSGRQMKKLPFLAHALFLESDCVSVSEFFDALQSAIAKQLEDTSRLT